MSIEVVELDPGEHEQWNECIEGSGQASPFHRYEALSTLATAADANLYRLIGYKGEDPVGVFPLFELSYGPFQIVKSPPTELEVPALGPVHWIRTPKQRKRERAAKAFIDNCTEWIEENLDPSIVDIRTVDRYDDVRPFIWNGFDVAPAYTYVLDLTPGEEALWNQFSSDARSNIRDGEDKDYAVEEAGRDAIDTVISHIQKRYAAKSLECGVDPPLVRELYDRLPEGYVRPYVCYLDGSIVGVQLALDDGSATYRWLSAGDVDIDFPVNEILDWHVIRDAIDRENERYDLVGGMEPSICQYKSKFGPKPTPLYIATRKTRTTQLLSFLQRNIADLRSG